MALSIKDCLLQQEQLEVNLAGKAVCCLKVLPVHSGSHNMCLRKLDGIFTKKTLSRSSSGM